MAPEEQMEYVVTVLDNGQWQVQGVYPDDQQAYSEWSTLTDHGYRARITQFPSSLREYLREQG